jgi:uncharacterized protein YqeY
MLRERISQSIKDAMKSGEKLRLTTLRLVNAAIKDRDLAAHVDEKGNATGRDKISDADILTLLQKMVKQRRESIATFRQGGREDLAANEEAEIAVIEEFMPRQMDDAEIRAAVKQVVGELGASGLKDMGRTIAALKQRHAGQMDFAKASGIVKELLK